MDRRAFLTTVTGGLFAAPLAAEAQPAAKIYRIGMLETRSATLNAANVDAFRQGMRELGYKQGQTLEIVGASRWSWPQVVILLALASSPASRGRGRPNPDE
jgi:hypothetical protein